MVLRMKGCVLLMDRSTTARIMSVGSSIPPGISALKRTALEHILVSSFSLAYLDIFLREARGREARL